MPTFREYPRVTTLQPTDAFVLDRLGVGTEYIEGADFLAAPFDNIVNLPIADPLDGTEPTVVIQDGTAKQSTTGDIGELAFKEIGNLPGGTPSSGDLLGFSQGGAGKQTTFGAIVGAAAIFTVVATSRSLAAAGRYAFLTNVGNLSGNLPTTAAAGLGGSIYVEDAAFDASVHNITLNAQGSDVIKYSGLSGTPLVLDTNGVSVTLVVTATNTWAAV